MPFGDLQRLRAFVLVLDLGSISAAATALGYTQSAVSQQIATLEREAAAALVDRSQRPLRATPAGAILRPHAERVLAGLSAAEAALEDVRAGRSRLRLAAFPSALSSFVPGAVRDLRRTHEELLVQVRQLETLESVEQLRRGDVDLAVVHHLPGVAMPETAGLQRHALLVDEIHVVLPEAHRLARSEAIAVAELEAEPLVLPRRDTPAGRFRSVVEHLCAQAGFAPRVAYEMDDLPAAQAFAAAGIAVVLMHGLTLSTVPPGATTRPLTERAGSRTIEALVPTAAHRPVIDELLALLTDAARTHATAGRPALA